MKRTLLRLMAVAATLLTLVVAMQAQQIGQTRTIRELNEVPLDSLTLMQTVGSSARIQLDDTPPVIRNDTVRVTGIVLMRPRLLTYTLARWNIFIQDTATGQIFAGLNVLTNDTSAAASNTGITSLDSGDVVTFTGRALEFGTQPNSLTEMYIYNPSGVPTFTSPVPVEIVDSRPRPLPREMTVDSFSLGTTPRISVGEKYEGMYVVIRNVTVNSVDVASGRFTFVDGAGNQMLMYDGSGYYTIRGHRFANSKYSAPPVGTKLSYIRGVILPQPRTGTAGEYSIMPLYPSSRELTGSNYPGDVVIDKFAPSITNILRTPEVPHSTDTVTITFKAKDLNTNGLVDSTFLNYRNANTGTFTKVRTTFVPADSSFFAKIPPYANNTYVSYYVEAYAPSSSYGASPDPTVPRFYVIKDGGLSIWDVQFTPYVNGFSAFTDNTVTVRGVITCDTSDNKETSGGRPRLFMAAARGAWNAVCLYGNAANVGIDTLVRGDSIEVTGFVRETNSRTVLQVMSRTVLARGVTVPADTVVSISGAGSASYELTNPPVDGNPTFEKLESVLITINNPYVVARNADNPAGGSGSNFGEFMISSTALPSANARFGMRVDDNGTNRFYADTAALYTAKPSNATLIPLNSKLSFIRGILDFSFAFYKLEPRKDDDFGTITGVYQVEGVLPTGYALDQNYPNPFNPTTTIRYSIPVAGRVTVRVFNVLGQLLQTLVSGEQGAGAYVVSFDASRYSSGMYFYQLEAGENVMTKKMLLMK